MKATYAYSVIVGEKEIVREITVEDEDEETAEKYLVELVNNAVLFPVVNK